MDRKLDKEAKCNSENSVTKKVDKKPDWLKVSFNRKDTQEVIKLMQDLQLNTVCKEANCPNLGECYRSRTATFMILGSNCTRNCRFCNVTCDRPEEVDPQEPQHLAEAAKKLNLKHVVVTSVTRDDLPDGGASQFVKVIHALREALPEATVEVLIPDFQGDEAALRAVLEAGPDVLNHNVETVSNLYTKVRPQAIYERSLELLQRAKKYALEEKAKQPDKARMLVKSGAMLGLGETDEQLQELFRDLQAYGCDILTLGQYLRPSSEHLPVERYVSPDEFEEYRQMALAEGIAFVTSTPLVRSSYRAEEALATVRAREAGL